VQHEDHVRSRTHHHEKSHGDDRQYLVEHDAAILHDPLGLEGSREYRARVFH